MQKVQEKCIQTFKEKVNFSYPHFEEDIQNRKFCIKEKVNNG
jgi:hypothetical protein